MIIMAERTNAQWVEALGVDDDMRGQAIEDLRTRLQRGIYYYLSRERSDLSDVSSDELTQMAQDFAQDATLRVLDNLASFRGDSQFTTWAMKIAMRVAISEMRRARYKDFSLDTLTEHGELPAASQNSAIVGGTPIERPDMVVEQDDVLSKVTQAFNTILTPRQRTAMELLILDDLPIEEVAERLNSNRNALYKLIHDARKKLRDYLEETGMSPDYILGLFER
jgi:RNA polymerase sigma-70 factor, ECF subfamily